MYIQLCCTTLDRLVDFVDMKYTAGAVEVGEFPRQDTLPAAVGNPRGQDLVEEQRPCRRDRNAALLALEARAGK
jgi:hypothetical protein